MLEELTRLRIENQALRDDLRAKDCMVHLLQIELERMRKQIDPGFRADPPADIHDAK